MSEIAWGDQKFRLETTWFSPFQMGSFRKCGLAFEVMQLLYSHSSYSVEPLPISDHLFVNNGFVSRVSICLFVPCQVKIFMQVIISINSVGVDCDSLACPADLDILFGSCVS